MKNFTLHLFLICLLGISFSNYSQDSLEYAENDLEDIIDYDVFHGLSNQYSIFKGFENDPSFGKRRTVNFGIGYKF